MISNRKAQQKKTLSEKSLAKVQSFIEFFNFYNQAINIVKAMPQDHKLPRLPGEAIDRIEITGWSPEDVLKKGPALFTGALKALQAVMGNEILILKGVLDKINSEIRESEIGRDGQYTPDKSIIEFIIKWKESLNYELKVWTDTKNLLNNAVLFTFNKKNLLPKIGNYDGMILSLNNLSATYHSFNQYLRKKQFEELVSLNEAVSEAIRKESHADNQAGYDTFSKDPLWTGRGSIWFSIWIQLNQTCNSSQALIAKMKGNITDSTIDAKIIDDSIRALRNVKNEYDNLLRSARVKFTDYQILHDNYDGFFKVYNQVVEATKLLSGNPERKALKAVDWPFTQQAEIVPTDTYVRFLQKIHDQEKSGSHQKGQENFKLACDAFKEWIAHEADCFNDKLNKIKNRKATLELEIERLDLDKNSRQYNLEAAEKLRSEQAQLNACSSKLDEIGKLLLDVAKGLDAKKLIFQSEAYHEWFLLPQPIRYLSKIYTEIDTYFLRLNEEKNKAQNITLTDLTGLISQAEQILGPEANRPKVIFVGSYADYGAFGLEQTLYSARIYVKELEALHTDDKRRSSTLITDSKIMEARDSKILIEAANCVKDLRAAVKSADNILRTKVQRQRNLYHYDLLQVHYLKCYAAATLQLCQNSKEKCDYQAPEEPKVPLSEVTTCYAESRLEAKRRQEVEILYKEAIDKYCPTIVSNATQIKKEIEAQIQNLSRKFKWMAYSPTSSEIAQEHESISAEIKSLLQRDGTNKYFCITDLDNIIKNSSSFMEQSPTPFLLSKTLWDFWSEMTDKTIEHNKNTLRLRLKHLEELEKVFKTIDNLNARVDILAQSVKTGRPLKDVALEKQPNENKKIEISISSTVEHKHNAQGYYYNKKEESKVHEDLKIRKFLQANELKQTMEKSQAPENTSPQKKSSFLSSLVTMFGNPTKLDQQEKTPPENRKKTVPQKDREEGDKDHDKNEIPLNEINEPNLVSPVTMFNDPTKVDQQEIIPQEKKRKTIPRKASEKREDHDKDEIPLDEIKEKGPMKRQSQ